MRADFSADDVPSLMRGLARATAPRENGPPRDELGALPGDHARRPSRAGQLGASVISLPHELARGRAGSACRPAPRRGVGHLPAGDRPEEAEPAFGLLAAAGPRAAEAPAEYSLLVESVREGYLLHYGEPRVVVGADADLALLAGDYLYALGLERLAALGDLEAIRELSDLISLSAQLHDGARTRRRAGGPRTRSGSRSVTRSPPGRTPGHEQGKSALREGARRRLGALAGGSRTAARVRAWATGFGARGEAIGFDRRARICPPERGRRRRQEQRFRWGRRSADAGSARLLRGRVDDPPQGAHDRRPGARRHRRRGDRPARGRLRGRADLPPRQGALGEGRPGQPTSSPTPTSRSSSPLVEGIGEAGKTTAYVRQGARGTRARDAGTFVAHLDPLRPPRLPGALRRGRRQLHLPLPRRRLRLPGQADRRPAGAPARPLPDPGPQRPGRARPPLQRHLPARAGARPRPRRVHRRHLGIPLPAAALYLPAA